MREPQLLKLFEGLCLGVILTMMFIAKRNLIILNIFPTNKNIEDICNSDLRIGNNSDCEMCI
jgi:hypothetical protein